jgi:hypothetical protein
MTRIKTFKVIFDKKKKNFLFYFEDLKNNWHFSKIKKNYFLGYFYEEYQKTSGEYLKICIDNNYLEIINDKFGTYNVFIYNNPTHTIISNSLSNILEDRDKKQNIDINIQSENIYEYFCWGYMPASKETIYNEIETLPPNGRIIITDEIKISNKKYDIFQKEKVKYSKEKYFEILKSEISKTIKNIKKKSIYIGLTSGKDSLLGSLILHNLNYNFDTAVYGELNSNEIIQSKKRATKIFSNENHYQYLFKKIVPNNNDIIDVSKILGGLSTLASSPQYNFHKLIKKNYNKSVFIDFSLFEFSRKAIKNTDDLILKYTTPQETIEKYFIEKKKYKEDLTKSIKNIKTKYKSNWISNFYLMDRAVKNQFYKTEYLNHLSMTKIAPFHNCKILNANHNFILQNKVFPYWRIFDLLKFDEIYKNYEKKNLNNQSKKNLPINYYNFFLSKKSFFLEYINDIESNKFKNFFNLKKISNEIYHEKISLNDVWFLFRFINLLIFSSIYKIKLK